MYLPLLIAINFGDASYLTMSGVAARSANTSEKSPPAAPDDRPPRLRSRRLEEPAVRYVACRYRHSRLCGVIPQIGGAMRSCHSLATGRGAASPPRVRRRREPAPSTFSVCNTPSAFEASPHIQVRPGLSLKPSR